MAICEPESGLSPNTKSMFNLTLEFSAFKTLRNEFLWFVSHLAYYILLELSELTKIIVMHLLRKSKVQRVFQGHKTGKNQIII